MAYDVIAVDVKKLVSLSGLITVQRIPSLNVLKLRHHQRTLRCRLDLRQTVILQRRDAPAPTQSPLATLGLSPHRRGDGMPRKYCSKRFSSCASKTKIRLVIGKKPPVISSMYRSRYCRSSFLVPAFIVVTQLHTHGNMVVGSVRQTAIFVTPRQPSALCFSAYIL